jgi:hypothetical protein
MAYHDRGARCVWQDYWGLLAAVRELCVLLKALTSALNNNPH